MDKKIIKIGTIAGRHDMPVDKFVLDRVNDPMDFQEIHASVVNSLKDMFEDSIVVESKVAFDGATWDEVPCFTAPDIHVELFITGLTSVTIECIRWFTANGISFTPMHFDRDTGAFVPQW